MGYVAYLANLMRKTHDCHEIIRRSVPQQTRCGNQRLKQKPLVSLLRLAVQRVLSATVRLASGFLLEPSGLFVRAFGTFC
jgi:hypothetical protein